MQKRSKGVPKPDLLVLARPKQWIKNFLVFAAPLSAGIILEPKILFWTIATFVSFCFAASAVYMANDVLDAEHDRNHPKEALAPSRCWTCQFAGNCVRHRVRPGCSSNTGYLRAH